jgi:8-oxo-dGTP diphosphatase
MGNDATVSALTPLFPVVAAALTDGEGRVFVQRRPEGRAHAGLWEFPGGKVEPGETPEAALVRELAEELGIAVVAADLVPAAFATAPLGTRHLVLLLYRVRRWSGAIHPVEASASDWRHPRALRDLAMPPADVGLVDALIALDGG